MNAATFFRPQSSLALVVSGLILAGPTAVRAQARGASTVCALCFRPSQPTDCDWFPITEFGVSIRTSYERIWVFGLVHPLDRRFAVGATLAFTDDSGTTLTVAPLIRVNLTGSIALDVAPGLLVNGSTTRLADEWPSPNLWIQSSTTGQAPGFALDASLCLRDWAVLFVRTSVYPYEELSRTTYALADFPGGGSTWVVQAQEIVPQAGTITESRIGIRAGSYPGLGLGVLAVLASIVVYGTIEN